MLEQKQDWKCVLFYFPTKSNFMNKWFSCSEFHGLAIFSVKLIFLKRVYKDAIINLLNILKVILAH